MFTHFQRLAGAFVKISNFKKMPSTFVYFSTTEFKLNERLWQDSRRVCRAVEV